MFPAPQFSWGAAGCSSHRTPFGSLPFSVSAVWIWSQVFSETGTSQGEDYVLPDIAQPSSTNNLVSEVVMADRLPVILVILYHCEGGLMLLLADFNLARMNLVADGTCTLGGHPLKHHYARGDDFSLNREL